MAILNWPIPLSDPAELAFFKRIEQFFSTLDETTGLRIGQWPEIHYQ